MHYFQYENDTMQCEGVTIPDIAAQVGTPFYVYSYNTLARHFKAFNDAFNWVDHIICFSTKANDALAVLRALSNLGCGADIVSGGELMRAKAAGMDPAKIVYSGVGKTEEEIDLALKSNILMFNVESSEELARISERAVALGVKAPVALRINPDIDPKTHPYISTGMKENKFGFDVTEAPLRYAEARQLPNIKIVGVDCHIGSQITDVQPFIDALARLSILIEKLREDGDEIKYLDLGGGLGITYDNEEPPHPEVYADALRDKVLELGVTLVLEPGRVIVGNAGAMITKVLYRKNQSGKFFAIVDAGMNDLMRPALYDAHHDILPVVKDENRAELEMDVVGPICESSDFMARGRILPKPKQGDLFAVMSAGAYGFTMSSNYNARRRPPIVLVNGDSFDVIRQREDFDSLIRGEEIPEYLIRENVK